MRSTALHCVLVWRGQNSAYGISQNIVHINGARHLLLLLLLLLPPPLLPPPLPPLPLLLNNVDDDDLLASSDGETELVEILQRLR